MSEATTPLTRAGSIIYFHSPHEVFSKLTLDVIAGVALQV